MKTAIDKTSSKPRTAASSKKRNQISKATRVNLRASTHQKEVIQQAVKLLKTTLSDFVLQRAFADAQAILAEQYRFRLSKAKWQKFCKALESPPRNLPGIRKLFETKGVFDE